MDINPAIKHIGEMAYGMAREMMLETGGAAPAFLIYKGAGLIALEAPFESMEEKYKSSGFATMIAGIFNADAIVFISEAWLLKTKMPEDGDMSKVRPQGSLEHHPDREEMLMLMIYTKTGEVRIGGGEIKHAEGDRAYAEELKWQPFDDDGKNQTALFKPWGTPEAQEFFEVFKSKLPDNIREFLQEVQQDLDDGLRINDFDTSQLGKGVVVDPIGGSA